MTTERIVLPDYGSHYYDRLGNPQYEVEMKTKPGQMRKATVADARANGWLPSVTTILGMVHRYALAAWQNEQYILAGATTIRLDGEDDDAFCRRIRDEGRAEAIAAAEFGTRLHAAIALRVDQITPPHGSELEPYLLAFDEWANKNDVWPTELERCFADAPERYGGRIDFIGTLRGEPVVIDWQTSRTMQTYPEKFAQVVAYKRGARLEGRPLIVTISSVTPGLIEEHPVIDEGASWEVFTHARALYYGDAGPWKVA